MARVNRDGRANSLAQTLLKCVAPGVPDLYQGAELWDHSLVDPDNRRPVDYPERRRLLGVMLSETREQFIAGMAEHFEDGSPKLWVLHQALCLRKEQPESFGPEAAYEPLAAVGARSEHVVAFSRGGNVLAVVQRFSHKLNDAWAGTVLTLPEGRWIDRLSGHSFHGGAVKVATLLSALPVALLVRDTRNSHT